MVQRVYMIIYQFLPLKSLSFLTSNRINVNLLSISEVVRIDVLRLGSINVILKDSADAQSNTHTAYITTYRKYITE